MLISGYSFPQGFVYSQLGQMPTNPFPICGVGEFRQLVVPYGSGGFLNIPSCGKVEAVNPFYYSITCYASGKLGLFIEPLDSFQDYNWEFFDVTGRNANDIFTDSSLQIIGNWAGGHSPTGMNSTGITATAVYPILRLITHRSVTCPPWYRGISTCSWYAVTAKPRPTT